MIKNNQPLLDLYIRNRSVLFLFKKSISILNSKGFNYWRKSYLSIKAPKVLYKIKDVPLVDLRLKGLSLMSPLKQFKDATKIVGLLPSLLLLVGHEDSLSKLRYQAWIKKNERGISFQKLQKINASKIPSQIIFVIYGDTNNQKKLLSTVQSIRMQSYANTRYELSPVRATYDKNALLAFIASGDRLSRDAAFEIALAHNTNPKAKIIYGDNDSLYKNKRVNPFFKPRWSPELLLNCNYLGSLVVFNVPLTINKLSRLIDVKSLYDLIKTDFINLKMEEVLHIPKIISHCQDNFQDMSYKAKRQPQKLASKNQPHVSIIIPFRDKVDLLEKCLLSIKQKTLYQNYTIILVNNSSSQAETLAFLQSIASQPKVRVIEYNKEFNYSAINNFAVRHADTELVLFLNNDTEIITPEWLDEMVAKMQNDSVGVVGARLLYADNRVQHAGVIVGLGGAAGHPFRYIKANEGGYFGLAKISRNMSAVTGACLMTKKSLFTKLGGFEEENLAITYNDVDYCLKVITSGLSVIYNPQAELYHYESASRGREESQSSKHASPEVVRYQKELKYFRNKWRMYIDGDPYYSPNLSRQSENYNIAL